MSDIYERMQNALNNSKELKKKKQNPDNDVYSRIDSAFETVRQQKIKNGTYESPVKKANDWIQTVNSFRKDVGSIKTDTYSGFILECGPTPTNAVLLQLSFFSDNNPELQYVVTVMSGDLDEAYKILNSVELVTE